MILTVLREETRLHHERAERAVGLPTRLGSVDHYTALLGRLYGFYRPLEERLGGVLGSGTVLPDHADRRKTPLLHADLLALGRSAGGVAELPRCSDLPAVEGPAEVLGCLYVVEGATLGGQVVCRQVARSLGIGPEAGCAFFSSYGDRVGEKWSTFRTVLTDYVARHPEVADRVVASAAATFDRFEGWVA